MITAAVLAAALLPISAVPSAAAPTASGRYVDTRVNACAGSSGCRPGIVVHHWHKRGSASRGVGWVYASRDGRGDGIARWLVKAPGSSTWKVGGKWRRAGRVGGGDFVETSWGRDGHTGPIYPRGSRVCVQFQGLAAKACVTLK